MKEPVEVYEQGTGVLLDSYEQDVPETEPPRSSHISRIVSVDVSKVRPVEIKRVWQERDCMYDCFVTETIKDMYLAGSIGVDDWVLVHFDDVGEQVVTEKIFKSW